MKFTKRTVELAVVGLVGMSLAGAAIAGPGGVDATFSGWLGYDDGRTATFTAGFDAAEEQRLELIGNVGTLAVEGAFTAGDGPIELRLRRRDGHRERTVVEGADPYLAMVEHFARVVRLGEPPARPVADSIATLELIDRLRTAAGLPPG